MLKLQQHTHSEHEMLKSPNSQLNDAQFGGDESLKELVRRKRHIMGDQIVLLPHQTTVNFLLKEEGIDNICKVLDEAFAKKKGIQNECQFWIHSLKQRNWRISVLLLK